MKNPYDGKNAGRNILITMALIAIGVFVWNTYISPLMAFGDAVNIKNTGSCTFTCFLTNVNNDATFTVNPGQTKTVSLPNIGGIYQGACYDPSKYVNGNPSTYTAINTANSFTYNLNIPQTNCVGTTTTQGQTTTTLSGGSYACTVASYDTNQDCIINTAEYENAAELDDQYCWGTDTSHCADFHQNCYLKILGAYSYHLNPNQGSPPTVRYSPCTFGSVLDCNTATGYDTDHNCQIQTAEYNKATTDKNNGVITTNCYNVVLAGYQNWALRSQAYTGCTFTGCTDSQLWAFDANNDDKISLSERDMCQVSSVLCYPRCVLEYNKNLVTTTLPHGVTTTTLKNNGNDGWNLTNQQIGLIIITSVLVVLALYYSGFFKKLKKK
jgi:hypothetical protein